MNNILIPEKNIFLLKKYHTSSKLMIPLLATSFLSYKFNFEPTTNTLATLNVLNFGFHSYISTSCIITDYVKPKLLSSIVRSSSLGLHGLAMTGFIYTIYKNNGNNLKK